MMNITLRALLRKIPYLFLPPIVWIVRSRVEGILRNVVNRKLALQYSSGNILNAGECKNLLIKKFGNSQKAEDTVKIIYSDDERQLVNLDHDFPLANELRQLHESGYCILKNFIEPGNLSKFHDELRAVMDSLCKEIFPDNHQFGPLGLGNKKMLRNGLSYNIELDSGVIRCAPITRLFPGISSALPMGTLEDFLSRYFNSSVIFSDILCEYKWVLDGYDSNTTYHFDRSVNQIKIFIPLRDIGIDQAPLVYVPGSQTRREWRIYRDHLNIHHRNDPLLPNFREFDNNAPDDLRKTFGSGIFDDPTDVTAKVGDVIIMNTKGLHRGSKLRDGYRLQLGILAHSNNRSIVDK